MKRIALALLATAVTASPVYAGGGWNWGSPVPVCGGTSFETCITANLQLSGSNIVVTIGNIGPGTITGVGLFNLPTNQPVSGFASISGWSTTDHNDINGVITPTYSNDDRWSLGTDNGINDGLPPSGIAPGNIAMFTFHFSSDENALAAYNQVGVGIHSQGYIGCSTKLFVSPDLPGNQGGVMNPYTGGEDNCLSVPEPGSLFLLGSGAVGMAFVASRRRKGVDLVDEDGNDIEL